MGSTSTLPRTGDLVSRTERSLVHATAARLYGDVSAGWPGDFRPELVGRLCVVVAAIAPAIPRRRLSLLARYAHWSILLDDRLDGADPDPARLAELVAAVKEVTAGRRNRLADPLLKSFAGILAELARCGRPRVLHGLFRQSLLDAVDGGVEHALLGHAVATGREPPPTAERYLAAAGRTVNYRSFAYALLMVRARPLTPATVDRLVPALEHAGYAVRLGNDLASVARDRAESTLNILGLRDESGVPMTEARVRREIARHISVHDGLLASTAPARVLSRSLRISAGLYLHTDLR
jgi:hypothetical protein